MAMHSNHRILYRTGIAPPALHMMNTTHYPAIEPCTFSTWSGLRGYYGYHHQELDIHPLEGYRAV